MAMVRRESEGFSRRTCNTASHVWLCASSKNVRIRGTASSPVTVIAPRPAQRQLIAPSCVYSALSAWQRVPNTNQAKGIPNPSLSPNPGRVRTRHGGVNEDHRLVLAQMRQSQLHATKR